MEELIVPEPGQRRRRPARRWAVLARLRARHMQRWYAVLSRAVHRTLLSVIAHDCLNVAQSTAYSAIVALFPALIVAAAVIGLLPDTAPVRFQLAAFFDRVLPPGVSPLLDATLRTRRSMPTRCARWLRRGLSAFRGVECDRDADGGVAAAQRAAGAIAGASGSGAGARSNWSRCRWCRLTVASLLVVFGHAVTMWLAHEHWPGGASTWIYAMTLSGPLGGGAGREHWADCADLSPGSAGRSPGRCAQAHWPPLPEHRSSMAIGDRCSCCCEGVGGRSDRLLPGAVVATAMWFLTTLAFGWYVTRFANYSEVYGSLGAGIALLFWLYIISLERAVWSGVQCAVR